VTHPEASPQLARTVRLPFASAQTNQKGDGIMARKQILALTVAVFAGVVGTPALAGDDTLLTPTPAAKIDSGLGELPPVSEMKEVWLYSQPAETQDNGLGSLPNVTEIREPWLYSQPAPKIDSGLGEITAPVAQAALHSVTTR